MGAHAQAEDQAVRAGGAIPLTLDGFASALKRRLNRDGLRMLFRQVTGGPRPLALTTAPLVARGQLSVVLMAADGDGCGRAAVIQSG